MEKATGVSPGAATPNNDPPLAEMPVLPGPCSASFWLGNCCRYRSRILHIPPLSAPVKSVCVDFAAGRQLINELVEGQFCRLLIDLSKGEFAPKSPRT